MPKTHSDPAGNLEDKFLLLPKEAFFPNLELGEKVIEAGGLILVYDKRNNLVYVKGSAGERFSVAKYPYSLLELLGSRPGIIFTWDQIFTTLYDSKNLKRPENSKSQYVSSLTALKKLRKEFRRVVGSDPITTHRCIGLSLSPTVTKTP